MTTNMPVHQVLGNFPMYLDPVIHARYLGRYELFKRVIGVEGNVIECGVAWGGGLMAWTHFSWILEPHASTRKIYGFDIFDQENTFPSTSTQDGDVPEDRFPSDHEHLQGVINEFSAHCCGGMVKTLVVKGNACETIPAWCETEQHALVSLLYLDFDVYEPTRTALECLVPRMPKGAIIAFDECNYGKWPGETRALLDTLGVRNVRLQRFPWCQMLAFCEV